MGNCQTWQGGRGKCNIKGEKGVWKGRRPESRGKGKGRRNEKNKEGGEEKKKRSRPCCVCSGRTENRELGRAGRSYAGDQEENLDRWDLQLQG